MADDQQAPPETLAELAKRIGRLWLIYIKGQFLHSIIIGLVTWAVGAAIGLRYAFLLGLLAGILETVPSIGAILAAIAAVTVALIWGSAVISVQNWVFALIAAGVYLLIQQIGDLLIRPRLMGRSLHLHPLVVLMAIIVGTILANVVGAYLAVPLLVAVREIWRYVARKLHKRPPPTQDSSE